MLTEQELQERISKEEKRWTEVSEQLKQQYQVEYGSYLGRLGLLREMLNSTPAHNGNGNAPNPDTPVEGTVD